LKTIQFFVCVSNKNISDPINDAEQCLNEVFDGDYWGLINACAHGSDGTQLYTQLAINTEALNPPLEHVPWITINNTYNHDAETNLLRTVCNAYSVRFSDHLLAFLTNFSLNHIFNLHILLIKKIKIRI